MTSAKDKATKLAQMAALFSKILEHEKGYIRLVSHYDADGISSAAIIYRLLQYMNKEFEVVFLKQLVDTALKELVEEKEPASFWIFADMGSGNLRVVKKYLEHEKVLIIDHHQPEELSWKNLMHFNPYLTGIKGEDEISSSGMAYILARVLSARAKKLVPIALVGAIGDMQKKTGEFKGINILLQDDAELQGLIKTEKGLRLFGRYTKPIHKALEHSTDVFIEGLTGNESSCVQFLSNLGIKIKRSDGSWRTLSELSKKEEQKLATALILEGAPKEIIGKLYKLENNFELGEFATLLNACGRVGKPLSGLKLCLNEPVSIDPILSEYKIKTGKAVQWYHSNKRDFKITKNATYIIAKDEVDDAYIGIVLTLALKTGHIKTKVAFAFANAPDGVKVSSRSQQNVKDVNLGAMIAKATAIMREKGMTAEGGGHKAAAGAKIPFGKEAMFIELIEDQLSGTNF